MLTITHNPNLPFDAELASTEVWLHADGAGFAITLVAVLVGGARLLAATAGGCADQPAAMATAERILVQSRLGQTFVSYYWGRPALALAPATPALPTPNRRVA